MRLNLKTNYDDAGAESEAQRLLISFCGEEEVNYSNGITTFKRAVPARLLLRQIYDVQMVVIGVRNEDADDTEPLLV